MNRDEEFYTAWTRFLELLHAQSFKNIKTVEEATEMRIIAESLLQLVEEETEHLFEGRPAHDLCQAH